MSPPAAAALGALHDYAGPEWIATEMPLVRLIPHSRNEPGGGDHEDVARYSFSAPVETNDSVGAHRAP